MKRIAVVLALAVIGHSALAQETPRQALKINPLSLFFLTGNVSYERAVKEDQSFQVGLFYTGVSISEVKYSGIGVTPEYRFL